MTLPRKKRAPVPPAPPICDLEMLRDACAVAWEVGAATGNYAHVTMTPRSAGALDTAIVKGVAHQHSPRLDALLERIEVRGVDWYRYDSGFGHGYVQINGKLDGALVFLDVLLPLYKLDSGKPTTLECFLADNQDAFSDEEIVAMRALKPGASVSVGGGAAATFTLTRIGGAS